MAAAVTLTAAQAGTAGQQAAQTAPPVEKKAESKVSQAPARVDKQVVIEKKAGEPVVWMERQGDGRPNIVMPRGVGQGGGIYRPALAGGPRLGIEIHDVSKEDVAALKLAGPNGVVVDAVTKDSAAEKAGLKAKDVLLAYDGETVRSAQQLTRLVRETPPGRAVKIALVREGTRMEVDATPTETAGENVRVFINSDQIRGDVEKQMQELRGQLNQYRFERRVPGPGEQGLPFKMEAPFAGDTVRWFGREGGPLQMLVAPGRARLGVTVQELTPELATYFGVKDGLLVSGVTPDSPAAKAGIRAGDVITAVHDKPVTSAGELVSLLGDTTGEVTIGLTRDKKPLTLKATIDAPKAPGRRVVLRGTPA
jgi:serine protease Do